VIRLVPWLALLVLSACAHQPTLSDARDYLHDGDPARAMFAARVAARAAPPAERAPILRVAFQAALEAGWSQAAAEEYVALRELTRGDDEALLTELAAGTLRLALSSQDPARRLSAAHTLSALAGQPDTAALLSQALRDPEPEVRAAVLELSLADEAFDAVALLAAERAPSVRLAAVRATALQAGERPQAALSLAQAALQDPDASVRQAAVELLGVLARADQPPADVRTGLRSALWDGSDGVVRAASRHLAARFGATAAWAAWREASLPVDGPGALSSCARVLAWKAGQGSLSAVKAALASPVYEVRLAAIEAVGPADPLLEEALAGILSSDTAVGTRIAALESFALAGQRQPLLARLEDPEPALRRRALLAADRLEPLAPDELAEIFQHGDPALLDAAALRLATRGGDTGRRLLVESLGHPQANAPALRALNTLTDPRLREPYLGLLAHPDPVVRVLAGAGLVRCGLREDRADLVEALRDPRGSADVTAAAALLSIQRHGPARARGDVIPTE